MKFVFDPIWSWPLVVLTIVALMGTVFMTYRRRVAHLPPSYRRLLVGLRLGAAVVLSLALLRPAVQYDEADNEPVQVIVVCDASRSMGTEDGPNNRTRRQALVKTIENNQRQFQKLEATDDFEVQFYDFAEHLTAVEQLAETAEGTQTSIGDRSEEHTSELQSH